jgi:hypothetical protein
MQKANNIYLRLPLYCQWLAGLNLFLAGYHIGKNNAQVASLCIAGFIVSSVARRFASKKAKSNNEHETSN